MKIVYSGTHRKSYRKSLQYQKAKIVTFTIGELVVCPSCRFDKKSILEMSLKELRKAMK